MIPMRLSECDQPLYLRGVRRAARTDGRRGRGHAFPTVYFGPALPFRDLGADAGTAAPVWKQCARPDPPEKRLSHHRHDSAGAEDHSGAVQ